MRRAIRFSTSLVLATVGMIAAPQAAYAVGQSVGRVTGTVTEAQTEAPVPGATISLSGGTGVRKKTTTQEDGTYEILDIPPGTYDLEVSYEGMKPIRRRVVVQADQATPVMISWSAEVAATETTVVQEERHLTNPDSSMTGQTVSMTRGNQLPIARSYQAYTTQIPGVTVGGGNPNVKGATERNNRVLINGLDVNDPVTNTFSVNLQQDALESVQVLTGGYEAKYNALGAVTSLQTRRGTNEFHGAASAYVQPSAFTDYTTFGPALYNGSKPWDYSAKRPDQSRYELNLSTQGPIVKDHLFFNAGLQYADSRAVEAAGPPRFVQSPSRKFQSIYALLGLTYVPANAHRFHAEVIGDPTTIDYEDADDGGSAGVPGANNTHPLGQRGRSQGGWRTTSEWSWQASDHVATKVMFGYSRFALDVGPQGLRGFGDTNIGPVPYDFARPFHLNTDDSTRWFNDEERQKTSRVRYQLDAAVTITGEAMGRHEAELGMQSAFFQHREQSLKTGGPPGSGLGVTYTDQNGGPLDTGLCDLDRYVNPGVVDGNYTGNGCFERSRSLDYVAHQSGNTLGFYVQDRWKPLKWLTVLPGLRYDIGTVRITDSPLAQTGFGFGPRFSAIADVTGDQKTIVQASYGRMTEMPYLLGAATYDGRRRSVTVTERYDSRARDFRYYTTSGGSDSVRFDFNRRAPSVDEILLSARREVVASTTLRLDYTYRAFSNMFAGVEANAIMDPTGTRTIAFANGNPLRVTQYGFDPRIYSRYSGLDLIVESRINENFEMQGGYTLSWSWGPGDEPGSDSAYTNPRMAPFFHSFQPGIDTRHQIKTATTYSLKGASVGLIVNWRSGVALRRAYRDGQNEFDIFRAPAGYEPGAYYNTGTGNPGQLGTFSDVRSWTTFRSPDALTVNLMVSYDFYSLLKQHLIANLQVNNVLGLSTASVSTREGPAMTNQFGLAQSRQEFRSFKAGLRYEF